MQTIQLDLSQKDVPTPIYAKQGDVGRKFLLTLTDNGRSYTIPTDALVSVWYDGDSGAGNYSQINGEPAAVISGGSITVEMIAQMLLVSGRGTLCVILNTAEGEQIGLWNIVYFAEGTPGADSAEATQYFTAFSEVLRLFPTIGQAYDGSVEVTDNG